MDQETPSRKLLPSEVAEASYLGKAVATEGRVVVVGAYGGDGAVFLFDASTGELLRELVPRSDVGLFGRAVDKAGNVVAVGASNRAFLFDAATGEELLELEPVHGQRWGAFGSSISIAEDVVVVGDPRDSPHGPSSGSAFLFDPRTGQQLARLAPRDSRAHDRFGQAVAAADGLVVVGAPYDDDNGDYSGSAYLYDARSGRLRAKLLPSDGSKDDTFGKAVAVGDGVVVVGAVTDSVQGKWSGSAYVFDASTGRQLHKLLPTDGRRKDLFGASVAVADGVVAVGAVWDDDSGSGSGSAYLFDSDSGRQIAKLGASDGRRAHRFGNPAAMADGFVVFGALGDDDSGERAGAAYVFDVAQRRAVAATR